ncbi:hypothetical protein AB0F42_08465 [Streptomyces buecherae]|uniref:hypothetical protein n=1 Tax=Streptomyces buecherae TaxID=2763006 RepID=UPI0033E5A0CA
MNRNSTASPSHSAGCQASSADTPSKPAGRAELRDGSRGSALRLPDAELATLRERCAPDGRITTESCAVPCSPPPPRRSPTRARRH